MRKAVIVSMLVLALASGAGASVLAYRILNQSNSTNEAPAEPVRQGFPLVVATTALPHGSVLQPEHVKTIEWAPSYRPDGSFTDPKVVLGRALLDPVVPDEPILESRLAPKEAGGGLASVIPKGKRAVSVRVNEVIGVAGFALPKTRVDVLMSVNPGGDKKRSNSKMVLQNAEVLAAGQKIERDKDGKPETVNVITLLVTPEEAEKLTLASNEGDIQLALRNTLDMDEIRTSGVNLTSLMASPSPVPSTRTNWRPSAPATDTSVEIIRGNKRTTERF